MKTIGINVARKIVELLSHGLVAGMGSPEPGQMCVEAVVCQALDLPHGDDPGCVMQSLRTFKIKINDLAWSSRKVRAEGLKRLALTQLGSLGMDEIRFVSELAKLAKKWASKAAAEAAAAAAGYAGYAAEEAAAAAAAAAGHAAEAAGYAAAEAAGYAAAGYAAAGYAAEYDKVLASCCEDVVQLLISMNAPGAQWLELAPCAE